MFDKQPTLYGDRISLRPLVRADFEALFSAASDPLIWEQHSDNTRYQRERFSIFFEDSLSCRGTVVVLDNRSQQIIGSSRFYDDKPEEASVIVGYTFLQRAYWGTGYNAELKALMLGHAFSWAKTVYFQVSEQNIRSQKALEKIGARYHHSEEVMVLGVPSKRLIFSIGVV